MRYIFLTVLIAVCNSLYAQTDLTVDVLPRSTKEHYVYVEEMPEPSIDIDSFTKRHLHYPVDAMIRKMQGRVYVAFVVDKQGSVKNVHVIKGVYPSLDKEAIRLIQSMPAWKPGKQKGENVNVEFTLPVVFKW